MRGFKKAIVVILLPLSALVIAFQNCAPMSVMSYSSSEWSSGEEKIVVAFGDSLTRGSNPKKVGNTGAKGYVPFLEDKFEDNVSILNCGIGGQTTQDAKSRFEEILNGNYDNCSKDLVDSSNTAAFYSFEEFTGKQPTHILLWLGTNDVLKNLPQQTESINNLRWFISKAMNKNIKVTISNLPPYGDTSFEPMVTQRDGLSFDRIKTFNALVDQVALEFGLTVVDAYGALSSNFQEYTFDQIHLKREAYVLLADLWELALKNNIGKELFDTSGANSCSTTDGITVPDGVYYCSCLAQSTYGKISKCENGSLTPFIQTTTSCYNTADNHQLITHHCP